MQGVRVAAIRALRYSERGSPRSDHGRTAEAGRRARGYPRSHACGQARRLRRVVHRDEETRQSTVAGTERSDGLPRPRRVRAQSVLDVACGDCGDSGILNPVSESLLGFIKSAVLTPLAERVVALRVCPECHAKSLREVLRNNGMRFQQCSRCNTVFIDERAEIG